MTSKKQETELGAALIDVSNAIVKKFGVELKWKQQWYLKDIVANLRKHYPDVDFTHHFASSFIKPDGGVLSIVGVDGAKRPILIAEKKNQGTNDLRKMEGLGNQSKGNAIERLGKNVIGLKAAMMAEGIFPFVCFGDGCDFAEDSSILDRVATIAMFGRLNEISSLPLGPNGEFARGSYFFRESHWTRSEMTGVMLEIAQRSIHFYFSKYGEGAFAKHIPRLL